MGRWVQVGVAALVAVAVAGCGGSGTTKASFDASANAACRTADSRVRALLPPSHDLGGVAEYATEMLPVANKLVGQLQTIKPPSTAKTEFERYLHILRADVTDLRRLHSAATSANVQKVESAAATIGSRGGSTIAERLGLKACAQSPQPSGA